MKAIAVLGSTGSIGSSTLAVAEQQAEQFRVVALAAGRQLDLLRHQISRHRPALVSVAAAADAARLAAEFPEIQFVAGADGLVEVASCRDADLVVVAVVGAIGLAPTLAAVRAGTDVALANKEALVVAGELVIREAAGSGASILPIDSEHCAIHQGLQAGSVRAVRRLILTASGGPFLDWPEDRIRDATAEEALAHPTWTMGRRVTVDSATMMNKGLEIIEARHLFGVPPDRIEVLVHRQSIVHSLVEYVDGNVIAQLAVHDMRVPIQYALSWPERLESPLERLDLTTVGSLTFEPVDAARFPAVALARRALDDGGEMPAVLNAADEVAVQAFLDGRCSLADITATVEWAMDRWQDHNRELASAEQALAADREARRLAAEWLGNAARPPRGSRLRC